MAQGSAWVDSIRKKAVKKIKSYGENPGCTDKEVWKESEWTEKNSTSESSDINDTINLYAQHFTTPSPFFQLSLPLKQAAGMRLILTVSALHPSTLTILGSERPLSERASHFQTHLRKANVINFTSSFLWSWKTDSRKNLNHKKIKKKYWSLSNVGSDMHL